MGNKHPKIPKQEELTRKRIHYLKKITKFSEAEIQDWHVGFFQDCPDGKLNKETLTKEYKRYYGEHQANIFCDYVFKIFDKNRDDSISFNEFLIAVSTRGQGRLRDRLGLIFDMYDSSRDKKLDTKELTALITAMYDLVDCTDRKGENHPERIAKNIMADLDRNHDNTLDRDEFILGCSNNLVIHRLLAPNFEDMKNNNIG
ncbi:unnamed protein product [Rotaria sordida]|uniref:EF-hand domain-containing protein n=1 Tax=Rotaria sordida TaxID=392033 RepID=A0A815M8N1_9BILA|nr:unnamed protein product [Rotaria sordida]CAF1439283.1 unnamed protein product [Rotaria sordida]